MAIDAIDAFAREKIERETNPHNQKWNNETRTSTNTAQYVQQYSNGSNRR